MAAQDGSGGGAAAGRLTPAELRMVFLHELAHVKNRDTLTMTITATLAGAISMLGNFAFFFGGNRDNNNPLGFIGVLLPWNGTYSRDEQ